MSSRQCRTGPLKLFAFCYNQFQEWVFWAWRTGDTTRRAHVLYKKQGVYMCCRPLHLYKTRSVHVYSTRRVHVYMCCTKQNVCMCFTKQVVYMYCKKQDEFMCRTQKVYMCNVCVWERERGGRERKRDREREIEKKEVIKCFTSKSNWKGKSRV